METMYKVYEVIGRDCLVRRYSGGYYDSNIEGLVLEEISSHSSNEEALKEIEKDKLHLKGKTLVILPTIYVPYEWQKD